MGNQSAFCFYLIQRTHRFRASTDNKIPSGANGCNSLKTATWYKLYPMRSVGFLLFFIAQISFAQIPKNPNQVINGQRNGQWTVLFDKDWKELSNSANASYYRLIQYQNGKPSGTARDYHLNGQLQWQGQLLSENPDVNDGLCIWFNDDGTKQRESTYKEGKREGKEITYLNGKKYSEGTYTADVANKDWIYYGTDYESYFATARQAYETGDNSKADIYFKKALNLMPKDEKSARHQTLKWWMFYVYDATGDDKQGLVAIIDAFRVSNTVQNEYEKQVLEDAEKFGDKLVKNKNDQSAIELYRMAARKRERKKWLEGSAYYYDLKGILDISYRLNQLDSMTYYFSKIATVLPPTERQLATHLNDWASYSIPRKQYDQLDAIEKACEQYIRNKDQAKEKDAGYAEALMVYGKVAHARGQYERALKSFADARGALRPEENQVLYMRSLSLSANSYNTLKKYDEKAITVFNEYEQWNDRFVDYLKRDYVDNMLEVIRYAMNLNDYPHAEKGTIKTLTVAEKEYGKESTEYNGLRVILTGIYEKQGKTKEAAAIGNFSTDDAKKIVKALGVEDASKSINDLGKALRGGNFVKAVTIYEKSFDLIHNYFASQQDYDALITMDMGMATCYQQVGNFYKAGQLLLDCKKLADTKLKPTDQTNITLLMTLGDFYLSTGLFKEADDSYWAGMKILDESRTDANAKENDRNYYQLMGKMAILYQRQGYYTDAESLFNKVIFYEQDANGEKSLNCAIARTNLADLYQHKRQFALAADIYEEVMPLIRKEAGEQSPLYINSSRTLANIYLLLGDYAKAEAPYLKAKAFYKETLGVKSDRYLGILADLGLLYTYSKQWSKADAIYNEQVSNELSQVKNLFPTLSEREKTSFYSLAQSQFNTYNVFATQQLKNNAAEAIEMYNLQLVSKSLLFKATDRVRRTVMNSKDDSLKSMYSRWQTSKDQLSKIYQLSEQEKKASNIDERAIEKKVNDLEKELTKKSELFANLINDAPDWKAVRSKLKPGEAAIEIVRVLEALPEYTFSYMGKGITFDTLDAEKYTRVVDLPDRGSAVKAGVHVGETILEINGVSTKGKNIDQVSEMISASPAKFLMRKKKSKETYTVQISNDSVFYRTYPKKVRYVALIVTPQTIAQPDYILLPNGNDLETKYVKFYKNAIKQQLEDNYSYKYFWQPIQKSLVGIKKVYFSPDGVYNSINPNTLYNTETKRFVLDDIELIQVSNTADILNPISSSPSRKAVLVGFPDYNQLMNTVNVKAEEVEKDFMLLKKDSAQRFFNGDKVTELPGTKVEVNTIETLLNSGKLETMKYMLGDASEEKIKTIQSPKLLHIATHGFFLDEIPSDRDGRGVTGISGSRLAENPLLRSGLLFAGAGKTISEGHSNSKNEDGILTAYEAMNLNLNQTELVVLSACETGLGKIQTGEGVYGLQRAFRAAGAQSVLMSLWKVDDQATQQLMTGFYSQWMKQGEKLNSFRAAQLKLREQFPHPYYWGAFVMIGQ